MKRRRSPSSQNQDIENDKRPRAIHGRPPVRPNSAVNSSSPASDVGYPESLPLKKDIFERLDVNKDRYDKKPRHKTRTDKYDLKISSKSRDMGEADTRKKKSSKRRRRKSGLVLNCDFKAPNAAQDRLTLKANSGPGMFHKGRASSPVHRRGVPDLSFTEMDFLSKRQDHHEPKQRDLKHARSSKYKEKEKGRAEQISEYFGRSSAAKPCLGRQTRTSLSGQNTAQKPRTISIPSPSNNQDLKQRPRAPPNHGLRRQSAQRNDSSLPTPQKHWVADVKQPEMEHYQRHSTPASHHKRVERPSSYYSWSVTPSGQGRSSRGDVRESIDKGPQIPRRPGPHLNEQRHHAKKEHANKTSHGEVDDEPAHESSVSQLSLDGYTKKMLLGSKQDLRNHFPAQHSAAELYTLNDLKYLARLEKLEASQRQSSAPQDEAVRQSRPYGKMLCNFDIEESDSHEPHMLTGQKESSRITRTISNDGQNLSTPQISLLIAGPKTQNRSTEQGFKDDTRPDPPRLQYSGFRRGMYGNTLMRTGSRSTLAAEELFKYPCFDHGPSEMLLGRMPSATVSRLALQRRQWDDPSGQRICSRPARDTAQRIIHDIEQEELRISPRQNPSHDGFTDAAGVVAESFSEQPSRLESLQAHKYTLDHGAGVPQEHDTRFEQDMDRDRYGNAFRNGSVAGPRQPYSAHNLNDLHRPFNHHLPKNVRFATDSQNDAGSLAVHDGVGLAEEQRQQQEEQVNFVDFWRPNILY